MSRSRLNPLVVLLCALSPGAQANLLTNGSFEASPSPGLFVSQSDGRVDRHHGLDRHRHHDRLRRQLVGSL